MGAAMASTIAQAAFGLLKRETSDADSQAPEASQKEINISWSIFILIVLLILALFVSYILQARRIQAMHETVISIFAGMFVGLILRLTADSSVLGLVSFDYQFFFNLLLPPIILASGYELHQGNFFRNIGTILTFAFAGTFISALVLGVILFVWALLPLESMSLSFVEAMSVGATLSATDPVTILAIFTTYKVDPKLYTIIFGESILNDAVAIVLFETAQRAVPKPLGDEDITSRAIEAATKSLSFVNLLESVGVFLLVFFGSLVIGLAVGIGTSLFLKFTYIRRSPKIESCIILLIAYASYFFATAVYMSGIVSLLFCGICMKHYAYHNMSRRTQLTTKFIFQVLSQLSENFIFVYLGLSLFTEKGLEYRPMFILVAVVGICVARGLAVFPLSKAINWFIRYRARRAGVDASAEEIPFAHQAMLFWAGLRGAVGVALAASLSGPNSLILRATVLVVVVLTVIIFGGTSARMLEILRIKTGVVEEIDSDDEFDIEYIPNGTYTKRFGNAYGHDPRHVNGNSNGIALQPTGAAYSSGSARTSPRPKPLSRRGSKNTHAVSGQEIDGAGQGLLSPSDSMDEEGEDLDLPPSARNAAAVTAAAASTRGDQSPYRTASAPAVPPSTSDGAGSAAGGSGTAAGIRQFLAGSAEDPAQWFRHIDENVIKPRLLLDPGDGSGHRGPGNV